MSEVSTPSAVEEASAPRALPPAADPPARRRGTAAVFVMLFRGVLAGLIAVNLWWAYDRFRRDALARLPSEEIDRIVRPEKRINERLIKEGKTEEVRRLAPHSKAAQALREHLRVSPNDGEAREQLAKLYASYRLDLACAKELQKVPAWWPTKRDDDYVAGASFYTAGRPREAEAALRACVKEDLLHDVSPAFLSSAQQKLIELCVTEDRLDDAREVIWGAYAQAGKDEQVPILGMLARLELERISPESRVFELKRWVTLDPEGLKARRALALAYQDTGKPEEADREIRECLRIAPADLGVWRDYLTLLMARGDTEGLIAAVAKLPQGHEFDAKIMDAKGTALEKQGRLEDALVCYESAAKLRYDEPKYVYHLAMVEERLGRSQQAKEHRAMSNEMRQAYGKLADAYQKFMKLYDPKAEDISAWSAAADEVAEIFHKMHMDRTANAWLRLHPVKRLDQF